MKNCCSFLAHRVKHEKYYQLLLYIFLSMQISAVRLPREPSNPERLKGFGYAEFDDVDSLLRALSLNEEVRSDCQSCYFVIVCLMTNNITSSLSENLCKYQNGSVLYIALTVGVRVISVVATWWRMLSVTLVQNKDACSQFV